ncbi:MAG TPA: hypothetical protein VK817_13520 [Trebonia sp.]|nr:hypothetical protein [Trebonia sp.]
MTPSSTTSVSRCLMVSGPLRKELPAGAAARTTARPVPAQRSSACGRRGHGEEEKAGRAGHGKQGEADLH